MEPHLCQRILGYDTNALYLSTMMEEMPCGKEKVIHYTGGWAARTAPHLAQTLKNLTWFGFAEVDIEIPEPLRPKFEEMCLFFYNKKVPVEAVPQQMLDYLKRTGKTTGTEKS